MPSEISNLGFEIPNLKFQISNSGFFLIAGTLLLAGCQAAHVTQPLSAEVAGNSPQQQLDFWHALASRPIASNDEAFHGLLLFLDGQDTAEDYAQRVQTLKSRKVLPKDFHKPAERAIERGTMAHAVCRILQIKGGVMMRLTDSYSRYALRELQFLDIFPPSSSNQTFSGSEFLAIVGRVEDYQRENATRTLPAAPQAQPATQPVSQ